MNYKKLLIKLVFGLALLVFIAWKISQETFLEEFNKVQLIENSFIYFTIFVLLMGLNWSLESIKWKYLMKGIKDLNFKTALLSVLAGISTGIMTPNRIGNFIGRTLYLDTKIKSRATLLTFLGNMAQFASSIIMGIIGFEIFGRTQLGMDPVIIELSAIIVIMISLLVYFYPKQLYMFKRFFNQEIIEGIDFVQNVNPKVKLNVLLLSLLRYLVFLSQYYLLLYSFNVDVEFVHLLGAIALVFLITTIIPSVLFGKLFVREASAIFVFTEMGISTPVILMTVFILWLINLAIPSFIGAFLLIRK